MVVEGASSLPKAAGGALTDLKDNIYQFGSRNQADRYIRTTTAITEYVVVQYGKSMGQLMKGKESAPAEPIAPRKALLEGKDPGKDMSFELTKYKAQMDRYLRKVDQYEENKAKVFVIIKGQCTLQMRNKLESLKEYPELEDKDNVIGLLEVLKQLAFSTLNAHYPYWTMMESFKNLFSIKQMEHESLASYYRRWSATLEVTEGQWGTLAPRRVPTGDQEADARNKFLACIYLDGTDKVRFGKVIEELNNLHLMGTGKHPSTTVEEM